MEISRFASKILLVLFSSILILGSNNLVAMKFSELIKNSIVMRQSAKYIRYDDKLIKVATGPGCSRDLTQQEYSKLLGLRALLCQDVELENNQYNISEQTARSLKAVYPEASLLKNTGIFFGGIAVASLFWGATWYHYSKK